MAFMPIFRILLISLVARCRSDSTFGHKNGKAITKFGELLKPPPPPLLANIVPVPFHGGSPRSQRQNVDTGYVYQPPPPPPPPPFLPSSDFKFPAPFYKQYNFNFVPPPQPFTTTPAPSMFQKVSGWLFPSPQTTYGSPQIYNGNSLTTGKKDCNPCNLVPWIPVLRYNLGAKNVQQNLIPTYGPPSPTAYAPNFVAQYRPQPFLLQDQSLPQPGVPHAVYGPPAQTNSGNNYTPVSTYGPPSPTHTVASSSPLSSTYSFDSTSVGIPSSSYGVPSSSVGQLSSTFGYSSTSVKQPSLSYGQPSPSLDLPSSKYGIPSSTYGPPLSSYGTQSPSNETPRPVTSTFSPVTPNFEPSSINNDLPQQSDVELFQDVEPANEFQLPKVTHPSGFRNSYGELITNTYGLNNIPFPVSATGAESTKIKTEVLPDDKRPSTRNVSLALANPAPFTLNRGRNIHTLQPVALPNLSVSPLPPIFNARPFRPITANPFIKTLVPGIDSMQQISNNVKIEQSVPLAEFTHSVEYPPTVIQSSLTDLEAIRTFNQSKAYRNIQNGYIVDETRDISSQASEDHVKATKSFQDASFETTGADFGNELYDSNLPMELKHNDDFPSNHKLSFADLRGLKDEDVDKYRTESNLQNIDSPLLYLKPSAPHKDHGNFVFAISTPGTGKDYEIYDEVSSTTIPPVSTPTSAWDESRNEYSVGLSPPPPAQDNRNRPKIVQIIVPYTTGQQGQASNLDYENNVPDLWTPIPEDEYQGRKVPLNTENPYVSTVTESYSTVSAIEESTTGNYDSERLNTQAILNDLYDVKEPPFDIIKLQHTIDDWTEQEYSKRFKSPHKTRTSAKYAKQIPDEYFTTISPFTNYVTAATNYYNFYDHEGSSSMQHTVTDIKNKTDMKPRKEYNIIERIKTKFDSAKNEDDDSGKKPHIYTAASSFRSTTTTPAPWGSIQTSISPLTKEKVYVVTAEPWNESKSSDKPNEWYNIEQFESKKTKEDNDVTASDSLPFKSPRFSANRPSFGFTSSGSGNREPDVKSDSSFAFSKSWHQRINNLDNQGGNNGTYLRGGAERTDSTTNDYAEENSVSNMEEDTTTTMTAERLENDRAENV